MTASRNPHAQTQPRRPLPQTCFHGTPSSVGDDAPSLILNPVSLTPDACRPRIRPLPRLLLLPASTFQLPPLSFSKCSHPALPSDPQLRVKGQVCSCPPALYCDLLNLLPCPSSLTPALGSPRRFSNIPSWLPAQGLHVCCYLCPGQTCKAYSLTSKYHWIREPQKVPITILPTSSPSLMSFMSCIPTGGLPTSRQLSEKGDYTFLFNAST